MKQAFTHRRIKFSHGRFSSGVLNDGWLYVSGQGPLDLETGQPVPGTIEEQTALTLQYIDEILQQAGCTRADVVKCTCYLADLDDFAGFNQTYGAFFEGTIPPARTTVRADLLRGIKVEIDAVARVPD